ncbi:MoxR family ATPase [Streptomyces sp. PanSC19]|uniref:AAA family ATPase n=1 Tax=Streptomyces sp. PanSC19 TaxID=1520455 RepID=UPI000F4765E0|nr:MoxR family ATPase [Streptomyces sp. PanSC19]
MSRRATVSHNAASAPDSGSATENWWVFRGPAELPAPPPWRSLAGSARRPELQQYLLSPEHVAVVNAALHLRRPLLVTGRPGTGKSSLAHAVAEDLGLGDVLRWPVNSRSTLADALYRYDAVGRLREASMERERRLARDVPRNLRRHARSRHSDIGDYLRLGPLGTALAATDRPRVLLIDELDKADIDLPNDLLVVLEEGEFEIPELARLPEEQQNVNVLVTGSRQRVQVRRGTVSCTQFPIVIMTSNGERDFPPAFLRRCVRLDLKDPDEAKLREIVRLHLGDEALAQCEDLIQDFLQRVTTQTLATDQLLAAVHLRLTGADLSREQMINTVMHRLDEIFPG